MNNLAVTTKPTPVLNTPDFTSVFGGSNRNSLLVDSQGLMRAIELVLLKDTTVEIIETISSYILRVIIPSYPSSTSLYIDSRFLRPVDQEVSSLAHPSLNAILSFLPKQVGLPYVWGGNCYEGIPEMLEYYPPASTLSDPMKMMWTLQGFDCSGLLYQAANGQTPRNTSSLIQYGEGIPIENLTAEQIAAKVQALDLLVWKGHVIIVLDQKRTIESKLGKGVIITDLQETLTQLMSARKPMNSPSQEPYFLLRRINALFS